MTTRKRRASRLLKLLFALKMCLIVWLASCGTESDDKATLRNILSAEGCTHACWKGIETNVTDIDRLNAILDENDIEYEVVEGIGGEKYYSWPVDSNSLLVYEPKDAIISAIIDNRGIVGWLGIEVDFCVSTVISEYGAPVGVFDNELSYPNEGLVFFASQNDPIRVSAIILTTPEVIEANFMSPNSQAWDDVSSLFVGECADRFNSTQ